MPGLTGGSWKRGLTATAPTPYPTPGAMHRDVPARCVGQSTAAVVSFLVSFTCVRSRSPGALFPHVQGQGRRRSPLNVDPQTWKVCWGQPTHSTATAPPREEDRTNKRSLSGELTAAVTSTSAHKAALRCTSRRTGAHVIALEPLRSSAREPSEKRKVGGSTPPLATSKNSPRARFWALFDPHADPDGHHSRVSPSRCSAFWRPSSDACT